MEESCRDYSFTFIKFIGGILVGAFLLVILLLIVVPGDLDCDDVPFKDINYVPDQCETIQVNITSSNGTKNDIVNKTNCNETVTEFLLEEKALTFRKEMKIQDLDERNIGSYLERVDGGTTKYRYKYIDDREEYVVGQIENRQIGDAHRYFLSRCDNTGQVFRLEEKIVRLDNIEYKLYKNDTLIGETSENIIAICKPDISLVDLDNKPLATLSRGCSDSTFIDRWMIINFQNDLVDNYVVGFIAYITTLRENDDNNNFNVNIK